MKTLWKMASGSIVHYCPSSAFNNGSKDARSFFTEQDLRVSWSVPIISCVQDTNHQTFLHFPSRLVTIALQAISTWEVLGHVAFLWINGLQGGNRGSPGAFPWLSWGSYWMKIRYGNLTTVWLTYFVIPPDLNFTKKIKPKFFMKV